ncbi:hypothetical protein Back11_02850 [Paenibacillus baekrokdamisoli]|uniref:Uncharacterized protein n=1 Tax=Paenibacillus baekrokdamisoli TaxID=1712516 RepID=A0A3G9IJ54_9BACL|nr:hypothetical protein [Paenibacillus baekrokdamisoli]MBB3072656.1 hypothetical protein [Paenibacillus baekrokdamisoli]BBH18940.1 hypothetical protein Back11_02850 [Paenibacillus baekrokdamisoli]
MSIWYKLLLYLHVLSAIISIGPFFALIPLVKKLRGAEILEQNAYVVTFRYAIRLAKHAGHVLVGTGILLVIIGSWSWQSSWIVITILILISSLYFLARAFSPKLRKLNEPDQDKGKIIGLLSRSVWIYLILLMIMLWFMVTKPNFW